MMAKYFYVAHDGETDGKLAGSAGSAKRALKADESLTRVLVEEWYHNDFCGCEEYSREEFLATTCRSAEAGHTNHRAHLYR